MLHSEFSFLAWIFLGFFAWRDDPNPYSQSIFAFSPAMIALLSIYHPSGHETPKDAPVGPMTLNILTFSHTPYDSDPIFFW